VPINAYMVLCRDHRLVLRLADGTHTVERNLVRYWHRPQYDPKAKCPQYEAIVKDMFRLSSDPKGMRRHYYEFLGYCLLPSRVCRLEWVLYGDKHSGKFEALRTVSALLGGDTSPENMVFADRPPERLHDENQMARTMIFPFFGVPDPKAPPAYIHDKVIEQELSGVLNLALKGLRNLIKRGRFNPPADCVEAAREYYRTMDQIGNFLRDCCVVLEDNAVKTPGAQVFNRYIDWSGNNDLRLSKQEFIWELRSRGIPYGRGKDNVRRFYGLALAKD